MPAIPAFLPSRARRAVFLFIALLAWLPGWADEGRFSARIKGAMQEMMTEAARLGPASIDGPGLFFGTTKINGQYALVDGLNARHRCTATFFIRKDDGFVRVSTNVIKPDGSRAVGTPLDPNGPAFAALREGSAYYGPADILGKKYETGYEPIKNAAGEIIGVYFIGYPLD